MLACADAASSARDAAPKDFDRKVRFAAWVYEIEEGATLVFTLDDDERTLFDLPAGPGKGFIWLNAYTVRSAR